MKSFASKVILVTGASSGIGSAIAKAFAKYHAILCLVGRNTQNLSTVAHECKRIGAEQVLEIAADLSERDAIEKTFTMTIQEFKRIDVLINNAGLWIEGGVQDTKFEDFDVLFNVNVRAPFFLTQLCSAALQETKGNVVNISSIDSQAHYTEGLVYGMTKSALDQFTKTTALELAAKGVRVNSVNPGLCETNIFANRKLTIPLKEHFQRSGKNHPLNQRNVEPEELAEAVLFLASDEAKMITGVCINVDGGRVLTGQ